MNCLIVCYKSFCPDSAVFLLASKSASQQLRLILQASDGGLTLRAFRAKKLHFPLQSLAGTARHLLSIQHPALARCQLLSFRFNVRFMTAMLPNQLSKTINIFVSMNLVFLWLTNILRMSSPPKRKTKRFGARML